MLMHCVKRIFWEKNVFGRKNPLFYGDARARLIDGGARDRFKKS